MMHDVSKTPSPSYYGVRIAITLLFCTAVLLVMSPFIYSVGWALVIVACTWPIHMWIKGTLARGSDVLAASFSTVLITLMLLGILVPLSVRVTHEASRLAHASRAIIEDDETFDTFLTKIPGLSSFLERFGSERKGAREQILKLLNEHQVKAISAVSLAARGVGQFIFSIGVTIFTCFYLFRCGEQFAKQTLSIMELWGGEQYQTAVRIAWTTISAVLYGVVVAALVQGILAGVGFYIFGAPLPLLFGALTILLGLIPFGPPLLYLPMSAYLLYTGGPWYMSVGLAVWGIGLISTADNIFRPLFISRATSLPVLFAFFGGLGGIAAFGMIGLFLGPILLALCQEFWHRLVLRAEGAEYGAQSTG